jgi:hypothetical protein
MDTIEDLLTDDVTIPPPEPGADPPLTHKRTLKAGRPRYRDIVRVQIVTERKKEFIVEDYNTFSADPLPVNCKVRIWLRYHFANGTSPDTTPDPQFVIGGGPLNILSDVALDNGRSHKKHHRPQRYIHHRPDTGGANPKKVTIWKWEIRDEDNIRFKGASLDDPDSQDNDYRLMISFNE